MRERRFEMALLLVALGALGGVLALRSERAGAALCGTLRERLPGAVGAPVAIERCVVDPLSASLELYGLVVSSEDATADAEPLVSAERARVSLRGLFFGGVALQDVTLIRPRVVLSLGPNVRAPGARREALGCPLDLLKRIRLSALRIDDARLRVRAPQGELRLEGVSVRASVGRRDADVTLDARSGALAVEGVERHLGRLVLEAALDQSTAQLDVQRAEANVEGVFVTAAGQIDALCDPVPQVAARGQLYLPLESLGRLGLSLPSPSGQVWARVAVNGHLDELTARIELQASQTRLGAYAPGDFSARLVWSGQRLILEEVATQSGEGTLRVSGEMQLTEGLPVKARIETHEASFARVMARCGVPGAWVEFPASVKGGVTGHLLPTPSLSGDMEFHTGRFLLAARPFDAPPAKGRDILTFQEAAGTFRFGVSGEAVSFDDIDLRVGREGRSHTTGRVRLYYDGARGLDITASADAVDLSDFGHISGLPWRGTGALQAAISGPYARIRIDGRASLRDFSLAGYALGVVQGPVRLDGDVLSFPTVVAQKGQTQYFGDVALDFASPELHVRSSVQLPDGRVEDVIDLLAELSPLMESLQDGVVTGRLSALAAFDSPASALEGLVVARMHDVEYLGRRLGAAEVATHFEHGEALVLEPMTFDGPLGRLQASGRWDFAGPLSYELSLEEGSTAELIDPRGVAGIPITGTFVAKAQVDGDTQTVLVSGSLSSPEVRWKGTRLGPAHFQGSLTGRDFLGTGTFFPGVTGTLAISFRHDWPFHQELRFDVGDLAPFLPGELTGKVTGVAHADGPLRRWRQSTAEATIERLTLARGDASASNTSPVMVGYEGGAYRFRSVSLKGPTTALVAEGSWGPTQADVRARGSLDLRLLSTVTPVLERTHGQLDFTATVTGPVRAPALAGSAEVSGVRFAVAGQDLQVRGLSGRADFSESRVLFQDFEGTLNEGRVRGRGDMKLERLSPRSMELEVDLEDVTAQVWPEIPVTTSGALKLLTANGTSWLLQGALDIQKLRYTQPLSLTDLLATAKKGIPSDARPDEWLKLDVDFTSAGDVRVDNNFARAKLAGKLKLAGTNVHPLLLGTVEVAEGAQAVIGGNTYFLSRGQVQFNGTSPNFELAAQAQVREYLVSVKAFGHLDDPQLTLASEPALREPDILSLLTLGVTSRERELPSVVDLITQQFNPVMHRILAQGLGLKDQQVRFTTSFNEVTGSLEPAVALDTKVAGDNFKVGITKPLTGRSVKAEAEYRFGKRISARARWDDQNQNTAFGNPGLDLRFRFEWE